MADVQPFRGLRYNLGRIGDLSAVISPPYDAISAEEQPLYYSKSPYNVIRLECGEERPSDSAQNNKYTRAAIAMKAWLREAILVREEKPAFYFVEHRFSYQGGVKSRLGLIACLRLEDLDGGQIRPHEMTMKQPAADRLRLLQACLANLSPVMGMFRHHGEGIGPLFPERKKIEPALSAVDSYGVAHSMWVVKDEKAIARVSDFFADKVLYIADGHHRYETALAYRDEQRSAYPSYSGKEAFNFVMMAFADSGDPNIVVLPTHRLARGLDEERLARLKEGLSTYFYEVQLLPPLSTLPETLKSWLDSLKERGGPTFGLYGLHGQHLCLLTVPEKGALREMMPAGLPPPVRDLDVGLLHWVILPHMLGIDGPEEEDCLQYTRDGLKAVSRVDSGEFQIAFLLNPAPISSVLAVADAGARMPQKSTYFYPKTPAGLVINPLWEE
jgi:uncharacterized protein (DUF1015 family)